MTIFSGIYAITDDRLISEHHFTPRITAALEGGISMLQYRTDISDKNKKLRQAEELLALCRKYQVPLIINNDIELCLAVEADGLHIGQNDHPISEAKKTLGENRIIGVTCHSSMSNAIKAQKSGASYVAFGRFFSSTTKPDAPPAAVNVLIEASANLTVPIVAVGGINTRNGGSLVCAGADMLAVVNAAFGSEDVYNNVKSLNKLFQSKEQTLTNDNI